MSAVGEGVVITRDDAWVVAAWNGEVDMSNVRAFEERTLDEVRNADDGILVDLSDVRYIDSAGIRALVSISRMLTDRQQRLLLVLPETSLLKKALTVGGVTAVIPTFPSLDEARAAR